MRILRFSNICTVFVPLRKTTVMKRFLLALPAILLSVTLCGARKLPSAALGASTYEIRYTWGAINAKVATATISLEPARWQGQDSYHSHAFIKTSAIFRLFIGADLTVDSYIAQSDLLPLYTINPYRKGGKDCKFEYIYDRDKRMVTNVAQGPKETQTNRFAFDGKIFDLLTLLAYGRFEAGDKPVTLKLMLGEAAYPAILTYQGKDTETFPGLEAERFLLRLTERGVMENGSGNELTLWRSAGPDRKVLGLEAAIDPGHMSIRIKN
jgi:hypothetical protein